MLLVIINNDIPLASIIIACDIHIYYDSEVVFCIWRLAFVSIIFVVKVAYISQLFFIYIQFGGEDWTPET